MTGYKNFATWLVSSALISVSANAQLLPLTPERPQYDENGVDVQTQLFQYTHHGVSIGPSDHRGLSHLMYFIGKKNPPDGDVSYRYGSSFTFTSWAMDSTSATVTVGNRSESFIEQAPFYGAYQLGASTGSGSRYDSWYTLKDGTRYEFGNACVFYGNCAIDSVEFPDGTRWTYHYRVESQTSNSSILRLQSITTNTGYQLKFYYQSDDLQSTTAWGNLIRVVAINNAVEYCNPTADSCSLSNSWPDAHYSRSADYLTYTLTDSAGAVTQISQNASSFSIKTPESTTYNRVYTLNSIYDPREPYFDFWDGQIRYGTVVKKVTQAAVDGNVTDYAFSYSGNYSYVAVTGGRGGNRLYRTTGFVNYGGSPKWGITDVTDANGATTTFGLDYFLRLKSVHSPEGNSTQFVFDNNDTNSFYPDARNNITSATASPKPGSPLSQIGESWSFPEDSACIWDDSLRRVCSRPIFYTDPKGNITNYTYAAEHGGKLTETLPADSSGIRPMKRYGYAPRYAWIKDSSGNFVHAGPPIYVLTQEKTCLTSRTLGDASNGYYCEAGGDEIVTSYDYGPDSGPNNLLVRGKVVAYQGESRRTCYSYDIYGNKISETLPRAGLATCP